MNAIIVPINDERDARSAVDQAIELYRKERGPIHLLAVQHKLPRHVSCYFGRSDLDAFYREAGMRVLEPAMRMLDDAGIPHEEHVVTGRKAESIVSFAARYEGSRLVLDNRHGLLCRGSALADGGS